MRLFYLSNPQPFACHANDLPRIHRPINVIFLKNESISRRARSKIRRELGICIENNILRIYYGINFMKNLENIESLRKFRNDLKNEFSELDLSFFDIKELVNTLINYFNKHKIKVFGFPAKEIFKTLDY